ncbi:hypothetical protein [Pilimelia anulata]|uniref:hypothetical protein n=1 Tax=Pilimelia anulata TaxID=53371 RepID=UPI001668ADC1|nr:hypothetical protein [Pilimelia anulata]
MSEVSVRPRAGYRFDLVTALLSGWFVAGLLIDGWAHTNLAGLESFFTPWHAVFYSGFVATAAWVGWPVLRRMQEGRRALDAVPVGYGLTLVALPLFAIGGAGDMAWHLAFGVEQGLNIAFSPTHMLLIGSMVVIVTGPVRSGWDTTVGRPLREQLPLLLGVAFALVVVFLLLSYAEATSWPPRAVVAAMSVPDLGDTSLMRQYGTSVVVTTIALLAPLLMLTRRGPLPPGAATIVYAVVAVMGGAVRGFASPGALLLTVACGLLVDGLTRLLRPGPDRAGSVIGWAAAAALVTWSILIGHAIVTAGMPAGVEYWTGTPFVAAGVAALLAATMTARRAAVAPR